MWQTLEHVHDPLEALRDEARVCPDRAPFSITLSTAEEAELRRGNADEMRFGTGQFCRNSKRAQFSQHHFAEAVHALLLIRRIITDQQNHCGERRQRGGDGRRKPIGLESIAAAAPEPAQIRRAVWKRDKGR